MKDSILHELGLLWVSNAAHFDASWCCAWDGHIWQAYWSEAIQCLLGFSDVAEPRLGSLHSFSKRIHPSQRKDWLNLLKGAAGRSAETFERNFVVADRSYGWRNLRLRAHTKEIDEHIILFGVFRDDTAFNYWLERAQAAETRVEVLERELGEARRRPALPVFSTPKGIDVLPSVDLAAQTLRIKGIRQVIQRVSGILENIQEQEDASGSVDFVRRKLQKLEDLLLKTNDLGQEYIPQLEALMKELSLAAVNVQLEASRLGVDGSGLLAVASGMKNLARDASMHMRQLAECFVEHEARSEEDLQNCVWSACSCLRT